MAICEICKNDYEQSFTIIMKGEAHVFDSFECAIHALAPECNHCGCRILGHGIQAENIYYCCAHCARCHGIDEAKDNVE